MNTTFSRLGFYTSLAFILGACTTPETASTTSASTAAANLAEDGNATADADRKKAPVLQPLWKVKPSTPVYYINSVASSGNGSRTVAGTFFHNYGTSADMARRPEAGVEAVNDGQTGTFGTYCYDQQGNVKWKDEFQGWQGVYWVDISTNGAWAASGGWYSQNPYQGFVRAYNAASGARMLSYTTKARVNQVALSGDGAWLVSAADTLVLFQRSGSSYTKVDEYTAPGGSDTMETIGFSADGKTLVAGDYAGNLLLFQIKAGKFGQPKTWKLPGGGYSHSVRITPSGASFAAGGSKGNFYLFDVAQFVSTGKPTITYTVPNAGSIYGVAIAADGSAFVGIANASGNTGTVYCVGRGGASGTLKWKFSTLHNPNSASYNQSANVVAVADGHPNGTPGAFYFLNATTGALLGQCATGDMSWPINIAAQGTYTAAGSDDSYVYFFKTPVAR